MAHRTHKLSAQGTMIGAMALLLAVACVPLQRVEAAGGAIIVNTPYEAQKAVFEFYFDHPEKVATGLNWLRGMFKILNEEPYGIPPDFLDVKVVLHGTEIVTLAKKNYGKYHEVVERMRYYTEFGVEFRVCAVSASQYGYKPEDFYDFVQIVPNAVTELIHWQSRGYSLIIPQALEKQKTIEELR
ncbi:MAG: DsrE family protein [Gammaproteobacteria bacterium]